MTKAERRARFFEERRLSRHRMQFWNRVDRAFSPEYILGRSLSVPLVLRQVREHLESRMYA